MTTETIGGMEYGTVTDPQDLAGLRDRACHGLEAGGEAAVPSGGPAVDLSRGVLLSCGGPDPMPITGVTAMAWNGDTSMFTVDVCIAGEVAALHTSRQRSGEHRLLKALLESGLHDLERYRNSGMYRGHTLYLNALHWIGGEVAHFSFELCCEEMGLNPAAVRRAKLTPRDWALLRAAEGTA